MQLNSDMQRTIDEVTNFFRANSYDKKTIARYALLLEEALLVYRDDPSFDTFTVTYKKSINSVTVKVVVPGKPLNPAKNNRIIEKILEGMEKPPKWSYRNGKNVIVYKTVPLISIQKSLKFIWPYMRTERKALITAIIFNVLSIVLELVLPILAAVIITSLTSEKLDQLAYMAIVIMVMKVTRDLFVRYYKNGFAKVNKGIVDSLSTSLARKMLDIQTETIRKYGSGLFIQRLIDDVKGLTDRFDSFLMFSADIVQYIGILIGILIVCPPIFIYQVVSYAIMIWLEMRRTVVMQQDERKIRIAMEPYTDTVNEIVRANSEIKLYRGKNAFLTAIRNRNEAATNQRLWQRLKEGNYLVWRWVFREVSSCGFLFLLILFIKNNQIDIATAVVLFNYSESLFPAVNTLGWFSETTRMFLLSCERLYQVASEQEFPVECFGDTHIDRLRGEISFENVTFAYPHEKEGVANRTVLNRMNLQIKPGEYVAITGRSGCGKSTMFNLITKLYETKLGTIKLDGVNINELDEDSIRSNIAIVTQNPHIFHMSIRDNLRIAKPDATDEEMVHACKQACIHDDIMRMENGYDTLITGDGTNISGGQRQRLAIAMCILKDMPILLMDEATSALDNITQSTVQDNIARINGNRTVIVIAHRMSTIVNCDRVLFMNDGVIAASGTHEELLNNCEEYRALYESDRKRAAGIEE